jgi:hypothetical protein
MGRQESRRQSAAGRRDARAQRPLDAPAPAAGIAVRHKDKKRWCRGKIGVEHKPKCVDYDAVKGRRIYGMSIIPHGSWKLLICTACGKELAFHYPIGVQKNNPPAWVTAA